LNEDLDKLKVKVARDTTLISSWKLQVSELKQGAL